MIHVMALLNLSLSHTYSFALSQQTHKLSQWEKVESFQKLKIVQWSVSLTKRATLGDTLV